jgi:hypothetical protein
MSFAWLMGTFTMKSTLLGPDYSDRLYITAAAHAFFALGLAIYLLVKRRNGAGAAAGCLLFSSWMYVWFMNGIV